MEELIIICSDITVKTDGNDRIIESKMIDGSGECLFVVNEGKLTLGDTEQTTGELIIRNDGIYLPYIINVYFGELNLNHGLFIQETGIEHTIILNDNSVTNIEGASILANNTAIKNNNGTVNFLSGSISAASEDVSFNAIVNHGTLNMSGVLSRTLKV